MPDVTKTGEAYDVHGRRVEFGSDHDGLYLETALVKLIFTGAELEKLREAIDRALMPGQVSG